MAECILIHKLVKRWYTLITFKNIAMDKYQILKDLILGLEEDFSKFYEKNNQAAGTRVRKGIQDLKTLAQDIRVGVQDLKNQSEG